MSILDENDALVGPWRNPDLWFDSPAVRGESPEPWADALAGAAARLEQIYQLLAFKMIHPPTAGEVCKCGVLAVEHDAAMQAADREFRRIGVWAHVVA